MSAMGLRVRVWIGHHWVRLLVAASVIGVASGLAMGIAAGTRRTDSAPDRYTVFAGGDPDLLITQLRGEPITESVRQIPGVTSVSAVVFVPSFLLSPNDGSPLLDPNSFEGDDDVLGARLVHGRFTDPTEPDEFTVNTSLYADLVERFDTHVGDTFRISSYDQSQIDQFDPAAAPAAAPFTATLVGVTESPTDFDDSSEQVVFSSSLLTAHTDVGVVQTIIIVRVEPGVDPRSVMDTVRTLPGGESAYPGVQRVVSDNARRAVRFQVTALWLVTALTALAAAVMIVQVAARTVRVAQSERESMLAIGFRRSDLAAERAIEAAVGAFIAIPIALVVTYTLTGAFPLGILDSFEPHPGPAMDWFVVSIGIVATVVTTVAAAAVAGMRQSAGTGRARIGGLAEWLQSRGSGVSVSVGARFAATGPRGRRPWATLLVGALGLTSLVGAAVVGLSLTTIVDRPDRWGVNFDGMFGNPYNDAPSDIVTPILTDPDVDRVTGADIGSVTIDGFDTATVGFDSAKGDLEPTVLRGRDPSAVDEIGLGAEVARHLHVDIGSTVEATGATEESRAFTVVGIVVTPASAGNGAAMTFEAFRTLNPTATQNVVFVDFRDGAPPTAAEAVSAANYSPPGSLSIPPSVRALARVTAAPFLFGLVLVLLLLVGCAYLFTTSVRSRRRDLAVLRALGANGRQLRGAVHCQATIVTAAMVAVALPLGIVAGRLVVTLLTDALGIVPGVEVPAIGVVATVAVTLVVSNAFAFLPARHASRMPVAQLARDR